MSLSTSLAAVLLMSSASALTEVVTYEDWASAFGKEFVLERRATFDANVVAINLHNARHDRGEVTYRQKLNAFGDLSPEEFTEMYVRPAPEDLMLPFVPDTPLPPTTLKEIDWRTKGAVTPIKSQGVCGSCWAFSAIQAVEGAYFIETGALRELSVQQVMDCSRGCDDSCGCNGGLMGAAFNYIIANGGINSNDDYNYTQISIPCDTYEEKRVVAKIEKYARVPARNESQLMAAVAQQPVSVGVWGITIFQFYSSGILTNDPACGGGDQLDHAVLAVGFGTGKLDNGTLMDYWTVKNSWGTGWGEDGYIRMERNVLDTFGQDSGLCGIAHLPSYPVVLKGPPVPVPPPTPAHPSPRPASWCNNCGENCEYQCQQAGGLKCDSQTMDPGEPVSCNCLSPAGNTQCSGLATEPMFMEQM